MKISIVIPNYNGAALLEKNLPKVLEAIHGQAEVLVVDDGSTDNSIDILKKLGVKFLKNEKNLGFSSTVNKGVSHSSGDIVVLLNTDVWPEKDFLGNLSSNFSDPQVFAVGFLDKSLENSRTILRGRGVGSWKKGFLVHRKGEINKNNTLWASGGSSAFRKNIWTKLGGMDELYNPFYWEDIDISYRALKSGYKILFDKNCVVFHEHGKGAIKTNYSDFGIRVNAYRNQLIFAWKNATDISIQVSEVVFIPYHLAKAFKNKNWTFILGFLKALFLLPKIIKSSLKAQRLFIKSDREVIKEFTE